MISESKLDNSFPDEQFLIEGYGAPFRLDRNRLWVEIVLFVPSDIPAKLLSVNISFESFFVEITFWKKKRLLNCSSNPKSSNIESHLNFIQVYKCLSKYEYTILLDFNSWKLDSSMKAFCETYNFHSLVKEATCFKNPDERIHHALA